MSQEESRFRERLAGAGIVVGLAILLSTLVTVRRLFPRARWAADLEERWVRLWVR